MIQTYLYLNFIPVRNYLRVYQLSSLPPLRLFTLPGMRQSYACPRDEAWLADVPRKSHRMRASTQFSTVVPSYQHTPFFAATPPAVSRLLRLSAIDRKEGKHRTPFALNDKRMDPDFSRQNYVILSACFSSRRAFTILNEAFYIFPHAFFF